MIEQTSRGGNKQVDTLGELLCLSSAVGTSDNDTICLRVVRHQLSGHTEYLQRQLSGGGNNKNTSTWNRNISTRSME